MKKIIASAVGLVLVGGVAVTTASAVENQFGGYWRTRIYAQDNMTGSAATLGSPASVDADGVAVPAVAPGPANNDTGSFFLIDHRTRLYYTAKFSDNFKFVNKFEFDTKWGDDVGGDIGADGKIFEVKNSYADFTLGNVNTKLGMQGGSIARGFLFADDFSGATVKGTFGDVSAYVRYISVEAEDAGGAADDDMFQGQANVKLSDAMSLTPYVLFHTRSGEDTDLFYVGTDVDMKMDALSAWGTFIYNGGEEGGVDTDAFLVAAGVDAGIAHGQAFYATGDDRFAPPPGSSYYWSEIMGYGVFDNEASNGSPDDNITNITAFNAGVTVKPMDKLTLVADVWYAFLNEEDAWGNDELGLEFDGKLKYALMDNLNAELILAYLVAGDATGDEDVIEGGMRVSLSF